MKMHDWVFSMLNWIALFALLFLWFFGAFSVSIEVLKHLHVDEKSDASIFILIACFFIVFVVIVLFPLLIKICITYIINAARRMYLSHKNKQEELLCTADNLLLIINNLQYQLTHNPFVNEPCLTKYTAPSFVKSIVMETFQKACINDMELTFTADSVARYASVGTDDEYRTCKFADDKVVAVKCAHRQSIFSKFYGDDDAFVIMFKTAVPLSVIICIFTAARELLLARKTPVRVNSKKQS